MFIFFYETLTNDRQEMNMNYGACLESFCFVDMLRKTVCLWALKLIYVLDFELIRIIYEDAIKKCSRIEIN